MPVIHIKVTPLSERIIKTRFSQEGPIPISRKDMLYHLLQFKSLNEGRVNFKKESKKLTATLPLEVNTTLYKYLNVKKRQIRVGLFLHKYHLETANVFIEAQQLLSEKRRTALKAFINYFNISEDDFELDSLYKNWQRWETRFLKKNEGNQKKYFPKSCSSVLNCTMLGEMRQFVMTWQKIVTVVNCYYHCGQVNLLLANQEIETLLGTIKINYDPIAAKKYVHCRHMLYYLLHAHCDLTAAQISKIIPQSRRMINYAINSITSKAAIYDDIAEEIEDLERMLGI